MADAIEYSKKIIIKRKIIREDDVFRIAKLVHEQLQTGDDKEEYYALFDDQSCITGTNWSKIFKSDEFKKRRGEHLNFTYRSKYGERKIEINIYNSLSRMTDSDVIIFSKDREWYNSICNQISTVINEIENQKIQLTLGAQYLLSIALGIVEGVGFGYLFQKLPQTIISGFDLSLVYGISCGIFTAINICALELVTKAYPNVEFSFGPSYLNESEKIKRGMGVLIPVGFDLLLFVLGLIL